MGVPVTLDSDDVLALLVAAEALGMVEDHFKARLDDVQVDAVGGVVGMRDRIRRVNQSWNEAQRTPEVLDGPTPDEVTALYAVRAWWKYATLNDSKEPSVPYPDMNVIDALRRKRLVVAGQMIRRIKWGDKTETQVAETVDRMPLKITERGYKFL